jgi:hypothetical protein
MIDGGKGWQNASTDEAQVREWWAKWPNANVAIACGPSSLAVLDVDHGLNEDAEVLAWIGRVGLPPTYTVRTGRRPEIGLQFYFAGSVRDVGEFQLEGCSGQVKSAGGYVMAAGCIHPDTRKEYTISNDAALAPIPDVVRNLRTVKRDTLGEDGEMQKIPEGGGRHAALTSVAGKFRHMGFDRVGILAQLIPANESMCEVPISDEDVEHIADSVAGYPLPEPDPVAVLGTPKEPEPPHDWREDFHTRDETENVPPTEFIIEGFLPVHAIGALAAPVAQRKSLIALNVAHACSTLEPLFDKFPVTHPPKRVLYLCPEMGLREFANRVKSIGLTPYVGKTFFYRTMNMGTLELEKLAPEAIDSALIIIDTAIRYLKGNENDSTEMGVFAKSIFRLIELKAWGVLLLHHSRKGTKDSKELDLENALRGSGELGAFLTTCWATRLQDPSEPYRSASYLTNVKQRDFACKPFEVTSDENCRLHYVETISPSRWRSAIQTKPTRTAKMQRRSRC